ncbi:MAG: hypothetical protein VYD54_11090, partial [Bdellovibrionota bacterium]|nr:hypothetical protein [Bdellovibrionota bacterium]
MQTVYKFGGSSLSSPANVLKVKDIIQNNLKDGDIVVVSAWGKTTDQLLDLWENPTEKKLKNLEQRYLTWLTELSLDLKKKLQEDFISIKKILKKKESLKSELLAFGEIWSARHLSSLLKAGFLDARKFLQVKGPEVDIESSKKDFLSLYKRDSLKVIPGFIARDSKGKTLNLGRDGSDYTATLIASFLGAKITLWTDVSGIYSADPRVCKKARPLLNLNTEEARELARCGTSILHPKTLSPLKGIQLKIKNTFSPDSEGTIIGKKGLDTKIINFKKNVCLVKGRSIEGSLRSQPITSGEYHLVLPEETTPGEVGHLVSLIGKCKKEDAALFLEVLRKENCEILFFDEGNHSKGPLAVFKKGNVDSIIEKLHDTFYGPKPILGVALLGVGNVGKEWLNIFKRMEKKSDHDVKLLAIADSKKIYSDDRGIDPGQWKSLLEKGSQNKGKSSLMNHFKKIKSNQLVIIDATASDEISDSYDNFFSKGHHIISANKKAGASSVQNFKGLLKTAKNNNSRWLNNATVGAGLPINHTLSDLQRSGDEIESVSGIFSGTLSWLFYHFDDSIPFSKLLLKAKNEGITEPDPREDLSGIDVLRKLLILSREIGLHYEEKDVNHKSILPPRLISLSLNDFLKDCSLLDETLSNLYQKAVKNGKVLRYLATVSKREAKMGIVSVSPNHSFAHINPGDNIFEIKSKWYGENPLIIR